MVLPIPPPSLLPNQHKLTYSLLEPQMFCAGWAGVTPFSKTILLTSSNACQGEKRLAEGCDSL